MAAVDDTRFREFMYSLAQRFSRQGISLLTTYETPDLFTSGLSRRRSLPHWPARRCPARSRAAGADPMPRCRQQQARSSQAVTR